jgi:dTDP-4-amino-4,6-dideoxygalactose transaminase
MLNTPFSPWPRFTDEEVEAVSTVLRSNRVNYWTGQECVEFEKAFAAWCGASHAISVANGTVALELALKGLGIGPGDEVVVTPRTFIASVSSIVAVGAVPVFADVDRDSQNITADSIATVLTPQTRAVICVHLAGWPCDMDPIMELANKHDLFVIEDCAQAHGAVYKGRMVGSLGHVSAWSFCQDKIMTTGGEGGMVVTNEASLWKRMWSYKDHGKNWDAVSSPATNGTSFRLVHDSFGTNWRMTEMQAAIGRIQLARMESWHRARQDNAIKILQAARVTQGLRVPTVPGDIEHAWYKCYVFVEQEELSGKWDRSRIIEEITRRGVPCYSGSCPEVYREKAFEGTGWIPAGRLPVAKELGETSIMFLVHPTLTGEEIDKTCSVIGEVMEMASE